MAVKFTNNAATTLAAGINSSATSISVTDGSVFPSLSSGEHFYCTFDDTTNVEIVKVTARSGNTLTVVRGQDDTTARAFSSGDKAELRVVAALLEDVKTEVTSTLNVDTFTSDGTSAAFTLSQAPSSEDNLIVFIEGVYQNPGDFTLSGTTLTLDAVPANTRKVVAYHVSGAVSGNNLNHDQFTADGSTAAFTLSISPIHENNTQVFIDGVYQQKDSYSVSGTTLTLDANPANGAKVEVMTFTQTDVNTIPASFVAGLTEVAAVGSDHLLVYDATDGALKKALASDLIETVGATPTFSTANITNTTTGDSLLFTTTEDSSTAAPVITLKRNSSSPADGDYLGQLKFKGENDADQEVIYAKVTGKISDASDGTEDGLLEFALRKAGSNNIGARLTSTDLKLINGTGLEVAGLTYPTSDGTNGQALVTDGSGNLSFSTISGGVDGISSSADATAITINSSEQVGIGISPDTLLHVSTTGSGDKAKIGNGTRHGFIAVDSSGVSLGNEASQGGELLYLNEANGYSSIFTGGSERIRINSNGNVGINTTSADIESLGDNYKQLMIASSVALYPAMTTYQTPSTTNTSAEIARIHYLNGTNRVGQFLVKPDGAANNSAYMAWSTMNAGTLGERMRIDSSGRVLIGWTSSVSSTAQLQVNSNAKIGNLFFQGDSSNSKMIAGNAEIRLSSLEFRGGGSGLDFDVTLIKTGVGFTNMFKVDSPSGDTFTNDGTISSLSDERIKTDINDLTDGLDIVKQLRPVTFKYNDTTEDEEGKKELGTADDTVRYGFIAQEVEAVAPQYVETSTRKINNVEVDDFKSMSTTRMIPMLFKAIQEQQTIIDDLKSRIETLENA